jgi:hypothetical protein
MSELPDNVVILFPACSPRDGGTTGAHCEPSRHPRVASAPARIDGTVKLSRLLKGLSAAGLLFRHDVRTGEFVILPDPEAPT